MGLAEPSNKGGVGLGEPNFLNRTLFHGDNLPFLRGLNSESVHLIATDPPFNKGKDFHATPDSLAAGAKFQDRWSWADDVEGEWVDQITDDWPKVMNVISGSRDSYGDDMGAFLCFMAVRLIEMRRVLRNDGSIYLHCDPTASHYLKELMDAIFGRKNFRNEIVWAYAGGGIPAKDFPRKHDTILRYTKSNKYTYNPVYRPYTPGTLQRGRTQIKGKYFDQGLRAEGTPVNDWWPDVGKITSPTDPEKVGYPTQKPLALYERIISASSNEGHIVLDPFAGCATTPIAAERLGRKWVGADIWDGALEVVKQRMEDNRQLLTDPNPQIHYITEPPERTDGAEEAVPFLQVTERYKEPAGPRMTRQEMFEYLIAQNGQRCQGCDRTFDDSRYLQLDHNTPRADGGINHITNRVLLCGPCNMLKSNIYTLSGLRRENAKRGYMAR